MHEKKYRIKYIHNTVLADPFYFYVDTFNEAVAVLNALLDYDLYLFNHNQLKMDSYTVYMGKMKVVGLEESKDNGLTWTEWKDDDGDDIHFYIDKL
jgi:hypothetical protein